MLKKIIYLIIPVIMLSAVQLSADSSLLGGGQEMRITVNNRILAKANGKAISVVDIMKKMDMLFYRQFPEFTSSSQARYQFYMANWKHVLSEMIDRELIVADAEESKLQVGASDVRQEMESLFGPNIIANLDKVGLTFDEASDMILADITLKRMMYFRVQMKAFSQATPQKIREYYDEVAKTNIRDNEWVYNVITVRHRDSVKAANAASVAYGLLVEDKIPLADLPAKLEEIVQSSVKSPSVKISEEYHTKEKELSDSFKKTLTSISPGEYSIPIAQKSRTDNSTVVRIFFLKNMISGGVIPFSEMEAKIKMKLIEDGIERESLAYITKLRQHFDVQDSHMQELLSSDFQPFLLK
ncbi:MAG: SurA N-terminal domain-containing protein [Parachlamydiaceae bacterium]